VLREEGRRVYGEGGVEWSGVEWGDGQDKPSNQATWGGYLVQRTRPDQTRPFSFLGLGRQPGLY
jgi:hypothetical protein